MCTKWCHLHSLKPSCILGTAALNANCPSTTTNAYSGELSHGTCHFRTDTQVLDLYIYETLSYMHSTMETAFVGMAINYH